MTTHGLLGPDTVPLSKWTVPFYGGIFTIGNTPGSIGFPGTPTAAPATTLGAGGIILPITYPGTVPISDCAQLSPNGGSFALGENVIIYSGRSVASGAGNATGCYTLSTATGTYPAGTALSYKSMGWSPDPVSYHVFGLGGLPVPGSPQGRFGITGFDAPTVNDSAEGESWLTIMRDTGAPIQQHFTVTAGERIAQLAGQWSMPDGYTAALKAFGIRTELSGLSYAKNVVGLPLSHNSAGGGGWTENYDGILQLLTAVESYGQVDGGGSAVALPAATITFKNAAKRPRVPDAGKSITVRLGANADGIGGQLVTYTGVTGSGATGTLTGCTGGTGSVADSSTITNTALAFNTKDPIQSQSGFQLGTSGWSASIIAALRGGTDSVASMLSILGPTNAEVTGGLTQIRVGAGAGQTKSIFQAFDTAGTNRLSISSSCSLIINGQSLVVQLSGVNTAIINGAQGYVQPGTTGGLGPKLFGNLVATPANPTGGVDSDFVFATDGIWQRRAGVMTKITT